MIRAKIGDLGKAHLGRVAHEVANSAVEMSRRMVEIFPVFDADEVRDLGREEDAAVPASNSTAHAFRGYQCIVLGRSKARQPLVGIVLQPRYAPCLVQPG